MTSYAEYLRITGYSTLIVSPVCLCACFPAQKVIIKLQKELLAASIGSICGFIFFEIIPAIINDCITNAFKDAVGQIQSTQKLPVSNAIHSLQQNNKNQMYLLSNSILFGMLFAFFLGILHESMEHKHCSENNVAPLILNKPKKPKKAWCRCSLSCMFVLCYLLCFCFVIE